MHETPNKKCYKPLNYRKDKEKHTKRRINMQTANKWIKRQIKQIKQ